ncbi:MAG: hypothetical protein PF904_11105 [Kiritimatiellae bacterium]|jgi:predicted  nucleic acid-binding Zn-ribbon protein|nr:hypothetical protein [Kiritimatiellia bacterium]
MKIYLYSIIVVIITQLSAFCEQSVGNKKLNDAMAERAALMVKTYQAEDQINKAWNDKKLSSPEIEKLRDRYRKLNFEIIEVREKLKAKVNKLPEMQKKAEKVKAMKTQKAVLEKKIKDLKK